MFTPTGIGMRRKRLLAVAIFSLMAFRFGIVAASELATEQPAIAEPTPTPSVAPSDAPQKASYSSCRVDGPYIAMTFDDGPHPLLTPRLLDMLNGLPILQGGVLAHGWIYFRASILSSDQPPPPTISRNALPRNMQKSVRAS